MTTKDEALAKALEALEPVSTYGRVGSRDTDTAKAQQAITAIREALAQPSEWVGLSLEEIWDSAHGLTRIQKDDWVATDADLIEFAHIVEARLREKNAGKPAAEDKAGGEPVAWRWPVKKLRGVEWRYSLRKTHQESEPLYTRPQPQADEPVAWDGLTKDEIWTRCCAEWRGKCDTATACYTRPQPQADVPVHKHEWFRTGAMEPSEYRCISCGEWSTTAPKPQGGE